MPTKSLKRWLEYIEDLHPKEIDLGLERIRPIFKDLIKDPIAKKIVIVGGTNGKGSTVEFLNELLKNSGKNVGTYTSPHIFNFTERIRINGKECSSEKITKSFDNVENSRGKRTLTYFEFSTLVALDLFKNSDIDVALLEVGLGGRLDAVNIVEPDISVLTNVELDHQDWLGEDREAIGKEKAAIFRKGKPAILVQRNLPKSVIKEANKIMSKVYRVGKEFDFKLDPNNTTWTFRLNLPARKLTLPGIKLTNLSIANASAALMAFILLGQKIEYEANKIIENTYLRGRCEILNDRFIIDVSHNPAAVSNLSLFIKRTFKQNQKIIAVLGVMSDKDVLGMIGPLKSIVSKWYTTSPEISRAMSSLKLTEILKSIPEVIVEEVKSVKDAILRAHKNSPSNSIILILGSFYTVSEALPVIKTIKQN